jgi:hypothetical protein
MFSFASILSLTTAGSLVILTMVIGPACAHDSNSSKSVERGSKLVTIDQTGLKPPVDQIDLKPWQNDCHLYKRAIARHACHLSHE